MKFRYQLWVFMCASVLSFAQVPPNINSGNPNFPFPQFLDYTNKTATLENLARRNSPGVTHAEMELRIREAYQILLNRAEYATWGGYPDGTRYIRFRSTCDCTEGDGYALLATAYMGDKTAFDGMYGYVRDRRRNNVTRWCDGGFNNRGKRYGKIFGVYGADGAGGATMDDGAWDGDEDIAMALMIAWKQWGDDMGRLDFSGNPISYKAELIDVLNAFVEKDEGDNIGDNQYTSGYVGYDGYVKSGNTFGELTQWAGTQTLSDYPQFMNNTNPGYVDYHAPSYYRQWRDFAKLNAPIPWNVSQWNRAEKSSDWLMGHLYSKSARTIPHAGDVKANPDEVSFEFGDAGPLGEDPRHPWRTILNYIWHGTPDSTWNPATHQVEPGPNNFERDMAIRYSKHLKRSQDAPWNLPCETMGTGSLPLTYSGIVVYGTQYKTDGTSTEADFFKLNWNMGAGSTAPIAAQDFNLMGEMYRECEIKWDVDVIGDGYLTSRPVYFHEWFRLLGMLLLSGNYQAPSTMEPAANMKIYRAVDKTFAYPGDLVTFTLSHRNFGKLVSANTTIVEAIPQGLQYVSSTGGGIVTGSTVTWDLGNRPGFNGDNLATTKGQVTITYKVLPVDTTTRVCTSAKIYTNGIFSWETNEYPNNITEVMERNCVDIVPRPLYIKKTVNRDKANPSSALEYTLDFGNKSVPYLNGGRPGVRLSFANNGISVKNQLRLKVRLFHGAEEAYIDYGNYRFSYFINDASTNWAGLAPVVYEGSPATSVTVTQQNLNAGTSTAGNWNQRLIFKFAPQLVTTTTHINRFRGNLGTQIHRGGDAMLRAFWDLKLPSFANVDWTDDWSGFGANSLNDADDGLYYPITNDWTEPKSPNVIAGVGDPIDSWHPAACSTSTIKTDKILVEEWDGYTWRRAFGNGPVSGREVENVVVLDTLPPCVDWAGFIVDNTLGITATYNPTTRIIKWSIPLMRINDVGRLKYRVNIKDETCFGGCPIADYPLINNASIAGDNESPLVVGDTTLITCNTLPPYVEPSELIKRITSIGPYAVGSTVSYELEYTNLTGSVANPSLNASTNWTRQSGTSDFTFGATGMSNISNQVGVMTYGFSHGTNGTISGTVVPQQSAVFGIALRHTGTAGIGNGIYVTFKPNVGAGNVEVKIWNGTTQLGTTQVVALSSATFDFKIVLTDNKLDLWINNFTGTPVVSYTGIPVRPGYAGFINGDPAGNDSYGVHRLTSWNTQLDSAFDLQFYDPIPGSITFGSASDGGNNVAGVVTWPATNTTPSTPLLVGTTLKRSWTGTINACNGEIYNVGYLKLQGVSPDLAALATLPCGTVTPLSFLLFAAERSASISLKWTMGNETLSGYYVVWASPDNSSWTQVGIVKANAGRDYQYSFASDDSDNLFVKVQYINGSNYQNWTKTVALKAEKANISVIPNPFASSFQVTFADEHAQVGLEIYNVEGKLMQEKVVHNASSAILGEGLSSGIYYLKVNTGAEIQIFRLVRE